MFCNLFQSLNSIVTLYMKSFSSSIFYFFISSSPGEMRNKRKEEVTEKQKILQAKDILLSFRFLYLHSILVGRNYLTYFRFPQN